MSELDGLLPARPEEHDTQAPPDTIFDEFVNYSGVEDNADVYTVIEEYRETFSTPYVAASRGLVDDIIEPARTREQIARALETLAAKRELRPAKKHGRGPT